MSWISAKKPPEHYEECLVLIDAPDLSCTDRHPIRLWKHFLIMLEEETVKYLRRYEKCRK